MNLGSAIKLCRKQRQLTQTELASRAGVSVSYLSLLERGERSDPGLSSLEKISKGLGIPLSLLFLLAAEEGDLAELTPEIKDKLSQIALELME